MGAYSRSEIEKAFEQFQAEGAKAASSGDWASWADLFTDDATYVEHHYGNLRGRDQIREWITTTMATPPNDEMVAFPIDWYVIDEEKGWVVCAVLNRMRDPGDGSTHEAVNWTLLKYAGDGKWSWEEDIYNPNEFGEMIKGWFRAKRAAVAD